jgi:hypothetical protein
MRKFVYKQQYVRPEATRVSDGVIMRIQDIYEVDPELMGTHFRQQNMPLWDTERIVECRNDHLDWMHDHFSYQTLVAGEESELDRGPGQPLPQTLPDYPQTSAKHPPPILPW